MTNISSGFLYRPWLSAYRAAETSLPSPFLPSDKSSASASSNGTLKSGRQASATNHAIFWDLARTYKAALDAGLSMPRSSTSLVQDVLSISKLMPADEEAFGGAIIATMRSVPPNCFSLLNLSAFTPGPTPSAETGR